MFRFVPFSFFDKNIRIKQRHRKIGKIKIESSKKLRYNKREQKGTHRKGLQMVLVATQVKRRRGTTAENNAFTGAEGEITVDTTTHEIRVHDGSTVGGHTIPTKNYGYSKTETDDLLSNKANVALDNITNAGKEVCADMAMPSNRYVNLTAPTHGNSMTAPADGWFVIRGYAGSGAYVWLRNETNGLGQTAPQGSSSSVSYCSLPVKKGDIIQVGYYAGSLTMCRFVYAEGAQ